VQHTYAPILAVQWHPEDDADVQSYEQALFDTVVDPSVLSSLPVPTGAAR
jgi:putative glutamine amidotransferase